MHDFEEKVSPWLRLLTPALLALTLFILNALNDKIDAQTHEIKELRAAISIIGERVSANETAIRIHHSK